MCKIRYANENDISLILDFIRQLAVYEKMLDEVVATDVSTHLALAEQYRRRAEYSKAAKEYQAVAQSKSDRRSKSEV